MEKLTLMASVDSATVDVDYSLTAVVLLSTID
jgi:hypothetical protein